MAVHVMEQSIVRTMSDKMSRTLSGGSAVNALNIEKGDKIEPLIVMKVRAGMDFSTPVVGDVALGSVMIVTEVCPGDRIKISTSRFAGWISYQTEMGMPLVKVVEKAPAKRRSRIFHSERSDGEAAVPESSWSIDQPLMHSQGVFVRGELAAGDQGFTLVPMKVREGEAFSSEVIGRMDEGANFEVVCVGANDRIKITCGEVMGWISAKAENDRPLVTKKEKKRNSFIRRLSGSKETLGVPTGGATLLSKSCDVKQGAPERPTLTLPIHKAGRAPPALWKRLLCCSA